MARKLIYIHGFNSSEQSFKAQQLGQWLAQQPIDCTYLTPRLHYDPAIAMLQLEQLIDNDTALIGSSLGGFYATYLSQRHGVRAVVVNPAVRPFELLHDYLGAQYNPYQQQHYTLTHQHVETLRQLYVESLHSPENILLLQQSGDEVLPYQQAVNYFSASPSRIEFGGDHSFIGFERYFDTLVRFLEITNTNKENQI
ncbi:MULTISPECIES: YqiA/YcfP family alpha/beta fold hydrolase [unclassified Pseudoalteromonas]|uniref:YqiA/YcfP family alpha/beta fold hydrolase n=1 Tax=unclassified Pseudoalteromonas TaxID=194690 RepID=UPI00209777D2|nr:YqiA/YcfP family alpha/beta fold hydrolase [Pseudoalteromonas sp. XMcav2-N]MCO7188167.1 esterase YqiA [Pseudoalteromonas sp. XMcav2-N]